MRHLIGSSVVVGMTLLLGVASQSLAQAPPSPVRYTVAEAYEVRRSVTLSGSVESRRMSDVVGEVEGWVVAVDVEPGDRVEQGQSLARLRRVNFELQRRAAQGRMKEAEARLNLSDRKLKRARELFDDAVVSQDQFDDAFSEFTAWQGRIDQAQAEIALLELALDRCTIRAPFAGVVTAKRTEVGQWVSVGSAVASLVTLDQLEVAVDVPERYFAQLRPGAKMQIRFEAAADLSVEGTLHGIIPRADPQSRTFPIKIWIPNPERRLGAGMLARVELPMGDSYPAVVVPKDALVQQGAGQMLYRINGDDTVEPVQVRSGQAVGAWVVVEGPVRSGERIVTRGNERLRPGQSVQAEALTYDLP